MSDLISREAAIALAKDLVVGEYRHRCIDPDDIRELPAIDAAQIVRCKDCSHRGSTGCMVVMFRGQYFPEGYCFLGERDTEKADDRNMATWIPLGHRSGFLCHPYSEYYKCSSCGYEQYTLFMDSPAMCPNCLSRMKMKERKQDAED